MINKKSILRLAGVGLLLCLQMTRTTVYAGSINANEQKVINYYNQTFYYKGKAYVATSQAKQSAYSKLASDGVDLTAKEANNYILQMSANVAKGIEDGYLVELNEESDSETDTGTESDTNPDLEGGNTETDRKPEAGNESSATEENAGMGNSGGKSSESGDVPSDLPPEQDTEEENESEEKEVIDIGHLLTDARENKRQYVFYDQNDKEIEPEDLQEALKDGPVTYKNYKDGNMKIVDESGTVLFESSIPDKGISLRNGSGWMKWIFLLICIPLILIVFRLVQKNKKKRIRK